MAAPGFGKSRRSVARSRRRSTRHRVTARSPALDRAPDENASAVVRAHRHVDRSFVTRHRAVDDGEVLCARRRARMRSKRARGRGTSRRAALRSSRGRADARTQLRRPRRRSIRIRSSRAPVDRMNHDPRGLSTASQPDRGPGSEAPRRASSRMCGDEHRPRAAPALRRGRARPRESRALRSLVGCARGTAEGSAVQESIEAFPAVAQADAELGLGLAHPSRQRSARRIARLASGIGRSSSDDGSTHANARSPSMATSPVAPITTNAWKRRRRSG